MWYSDLLVQLLLPLSEPMTSYRRVDELKASFKHTCSLNENSYFTIDVGDTSTIQLHIHGDMEDTIRCEYDYLKVCSILKHTW